MKPKKSLLNQYLVINFLIATLVPILIIVATLGISPSNEIVGGVNRSSNYSVLLGLILAIFLFISWTFFYTIRRRLLRLQQAMAEPAENGIPLAIPINKNDEIGQLENSFNIMVRKLEESREREQAEDVLRKQLIANLSHDLRTPLTTIRGHAYSLKKEPLSLKGQESLDLIDHKINHLGQLIENLLSYTLLTSGKYPYSPVKTDIVRLVRKSFAAWYPVFENMGFSIAVDLPETTFEWEVDPQWMERMLDNFYENIKRHANDGKYIAIRIEPEAEMIVIEDHGPGLDADSTDKGAGIGLSIAALMLKEMRLHHKIETNANGTTITITK